MCVYYVVFYCTILYCTVVMNTQQVCNAAETVGYGV